MPNFHDASVLTPPTRSVEGRLRQQLDANWLREMRPETQPKTEVEKPINFWQLTSPYAVERCKSVVIWGRGQVLALEGLVSAARGVCWISSGGLDATWARTVRSVASSTSVGEGSAARGAA